MTVEAAREIALSFEGTFESSHQGHPDFRISKGIFATLWPDKGISVLRLPMELAESEAARLPSVYRLVSRFAGMGWLSVTLEMVEEEEFRPLVEIAWQARSR